MKIYINPNRNEWDEIVRRPHLDTSQLNKTVSEVLTDIKKGGDRAVIEYEKKFDHVILDSLAVSPEDIEKALLTTEPALLEALRTAHDNISNFHESQKFESLKIETAPGVVCWQKSVPITRVGLYIPGGTAPLFSTVLMLATPAKIAGCREIILCTPPDNSGNINPAILAAASIAGVNRIFKAGGVQAIGAMAYGTESIPKVSKIFGPGNQYVMAAKQQVSINDVAIDMPAGPSEVCVIADSCGNPRYIAADLLSQAEHGSDSQVIFITNSEKLLKQVESEIRIQVEKLPRRETALRALENSKLILTPSLNEAMSLSNVYAPEHLILAVKNYEEMANMVENAGSVFLGNYACESAGDYASGTNHTLPTHGHAKAYSGVNLDSYNRKITFQHLSSVGVASIGSAVVTMAENESLEAHAQAMRVRLEDIKNNSK